MLRIVLSRRAQQDLKRIGPGSALSRIQRAVQGLANERPLDRKALVGAEPWRRLRVGDYRVLYRPVDPDEAGGSVADLLVARVVHRRDLERAVTTLK